jgi:hypothetical protein
LLGSGSPKAMVAPELTQVYTGLDNASVNTHSRGNGWNRPIHELLVVVADPRFDSRYKRKFILERKFIRTGVSVVNEDSF